jgi:diguanylate cyclase (GGDEF)-like protein
VDLPARYGGEEFAVIVPSETAVGAAKLAERCRQEIANVNVHVGREKVSITASFGVSDTTKANSPEMLLKQADEALYAAKNAGRNRVCIYGEVESSLSTC